MSQNEEKQKKDILVVGSGGHGREVLSIILESGKYNPVGFVDDDESKHGTLIDGYKVLCAIDEVKTKFNSNSVLIICALGDPHTNRRVTDRMKSMGFQFGNAISPHAHISSGSVVGEGVIIFPQVVVSCGVVIGDHVTVNMGTTISHDTRVSSYVNINPGVHLAGNVVIKEGAYIGLGTNVIQGIMIGECSLLGAGSIVIRDVPSKTMALGVPAKAVKSLTDCGHNEG